MADAVAPGAEAPPEVGVVVLGAVVVVVVLEGAAVDNRFAPSRLEGFGASDVALPAGFPNN